MRGLGHTLVAAALAGALAACNGGSIGPPPEDATLTPGAHTMALSLEAVASSPLPASGVAVEVTLPAGVTVQGDASSGLVSGGVLTAGSALPVRRTIKGAWSANPGTLRLVLATLPEGPWTGEILRLGFEVAQGTEVTRADLERLGSPGARVTVVGVDPEAQASIDLTDAYKVGIQLAN